MDFSARLQKAVERGRHKRDAADRQQAVQAMSEEESKTLHAQARLELTDHIEECLKQTVDQFPGFDFQTVVNPEGYGARIFRDDLRSRGREFAHDYSHLEFIVRSYSPGRLLEMVCRGAIANKEVLNRNQYQMLADLDLDVFRNLIDQWVLEYAEKFAAAQR